jgi:hypothetical protein
MADALQLMEHQKYGLALKHDLITAVENLRIPKMTQVVNVGQPQNVYVNRYASSVDIVICEPASPYRQSEIKTGQVYTVVPMQLLIALNEIEGNCECAPNDMWCVNRREGR